jgi:hypothetical protein
MSFFGRLFGRGVTKVHRSPLSTKALRETTPTAPSSHELLELLRKRRDPADPRAELLVRKMHFDMRYRCGAMGRCSVGRAECCFSQCFTMRPHSKGEDVFTERMSIEEPLLEDDAAPADMRAVAAMCRDDQLDDAVTALDRLIIPAVAAGLTTDDACQRVVALASWRAVLLVNLRRDADAVTSLLEVATALEPQHRPVLLVAAAGWAALHDMEVRFYRYHLAAFPDLREEFAPEMRDIDTRADNQLAQVVRAATAEGEECVAAVAQEVFVREVSCVVSRAQASRELGDSTEDPMTTPVVADSIAAYSKLGSAFWDDFMDLAMMPPMPPAEDGSGAHVTDAMGRLTILHHVAALYSPPPPQEGEPGYGRPQGGKPRINPSSPQQRRVLSRMNDLLAVVREATGQGSHPGK